MLNVNWLRKAGVELTRLKPWELHEYVPKEIMKEAKKLFPKDVHDRNCYLYDNYLSAEEDRREEECSKLIHPFITKHHRLVNEFGTDPGCFEISSTILNSWGMLKEFYTTVDDFCEMLGLVRYSEEMCGTGGHIHISIENSLKAQIVRKVMLNHPEIMFAFANPSDPHHGLRNVSRSDAMGGYYDNIYTDERACCDKSGPIAYRSYYETIEFRLFDMAQTWEMQEEHMAFAQAFTEHAIKGGKPERLLYRNEVENRSVNDHIVNFEKLIHKLKLPWRRYRFYAEMIETRFKFKTDNFRMY